MRLRTKFAIAVVAVTLVLSGSIFVAVEVYTQDAVEESRANVDQTATLAAEQIDAAVRDQRDYVGLVASRPRTREFDRSGQVLEAFLANSRFYAAQIVDTNGTVVDFRGDVTAAQRRAVLGSNRGTEPYVREALEGRSHVGEAEAVDGRDAHVLVFSAPIFEGGEVEGVLAAAIYLDSRTVFDALPALNTSHQAVAVTGNGTALHGSDRAFPASIEGSATVDSTGWTVTVERDRSGLDARLRRLALFQVGQLGLVVLVMAGFGYWQYAASLRQTERLLDGFDDLGGGTEWEQIGDGFNDLVATLGAREAALRERTQRLEVLYRVLRHNLRNQLSVLITYADVIADVTDDDQIHAAARSILDAGRRLTNLSDRARQIETALETDQEPTPVEVSGVVSEVVADLRDAYPDVEITTALPEASWVVALPSLRLAIENVCENACEHNDADDPHVDVSVEPADGTAMGQTSGDSTGSEGSGIDADRVRIAVADNGPGLPEGDLTAIREGRETDLEHASGLGLWLSYWLVDGSDGELRFADAEPRGTVVEIVLPRGARDADGDHR